MRRLKILSCVILLSSCLFDGGKKRIKNHYYLEWVDTPDNICIAYYEEQYRLFDPVTEYGIESYNLVKDRIIVAHKGNKHFVINANRPPIEAHSYKNKIPLIGKAYTDGLKKLGITLDDLKDPLPAKSGLF